MQHNLTWITPNTPVLRGLIRDFHHDYDFFDAKFAYSRRF